MKENNIFNLEYNNKMTPSQKSRKKKIELWNKPTDIKTITIWVTNLPFFILLSLDSVYYPL